MALEPEHMKFTPVERRNTLALQSASWKNAFGRDV
jgi:hypothetical protein